MSGLNNLQKRLNYRGGAKQVDRMIADKKRSLDDSLWRSYQSATAVMMMNEEKEFRCLINPNKLSMELDDKVISINYEETCLNGEGGIQATGIKCGDVIQWKENGTYWIVYSQYLQEIAYFRGQMRQCESEPIYIEGQPFWFYLKGPDEKGIDWQKSKHFIFNDLNYNIEIYISNNSVTNEFFQRFKKCKILGKPYEVQAVDRLSTEGILAVYLKEDFENKWIEDEKPEIEEETPPVEEAPTTFRMTRNVTVPSIEGPTEVYPYDTVTYKVLNAAPGAWSLSNKRARIISSTESSVTIEITTGRSGSVSLIYKMENNDIIHNINILSL